LDSRRVEIVADSAYCNSTLTSELPKHLVLFGVMRPDAALPALPAEQDQKRGGRPRVRGQRVTAHTILDNLGPIRSRYVSLPIHLRYVPVKALRPREAVRFAQP
jgi:hypothetical protein